MSQQNQTLNMALGIAGATQALQEEYPDAMGINALWIAILALYGSPGVTVIQSLSVNVPRSDL